MFLLVFFMGGCINMPVNEDKLTHERAAEITDELNNVCITWTSGKVTVKHSDDDAVHIVQKYGDGFSEDWLFDYEVKNDTLNITDPREHILTGPGSMYTMLTVSLTDDYYDSLNIYAASASCVVDYADENSDEALIRDILINTASGSVTANVDTDKLGISTASGSITANSTAHDLEISTASGSIKFGHEKSGFSNAQFSSISGSVDVKQVVPSDSLNIETVSGSVSIDCMSEVSTLGISTTSGSVDLTASEAIKNLDAESVSGSYVIKWNGDYGFDLDFSSVSGRLKNYFKTDVYSDGECKLSISTVSGSVLIQPISKPI